MAPPKSIIIAALLVLLPSGSASAGNRFAVEVLLGSALNAGSSLTISQSGEPDIEIDAEYATKAFEFPLYYAIRLARFDAHGAWEFQFIHHKIYLENTTDEVERFEISHGFNILTVNRAFPTGPVDLRAGAGVVIGHPDSQVRGLESSQEGILGTGYELAGPALLAGAGKRLRISERWSAAVDAQVTAGWATVSIAEGEASTWNLAFHLMFGIGYGW